MDHNIEQLKDRYHCPVEATIEVIGGKWKCLIIHHLLGGTKRFNVLKRLLPNVTQRMLTSQLRELERIGIIHREVYAQVPPKVEYSLTSCGKTLEPVLWVMHSWGEKFLEITQESTLPLPRIHNTESKETNEEKQDRKVVTAK